MAKQIIAWCDPHLLRDEQVIGNQHVITIDGVERAIDLCDDCAKELIEPLHNLLVEVGQPTQAAGRIKPTKTNEFHCPMPECDRAFGSREGLRKHLAKLHETTLTNVENQLGAGAVAEALNESSLPFACEDDESCSRRFSTPQGLGAHRARVHGYVSPHTSKQAS